MLQNQPIKKGLLLPNNILENSKIHLTKALENVPSSVFHLEPWNDPSLFKSSLLMKKEKADDPANLHKYQFDFATCNDVLWKNSVAKPTKNSVF